MKHFQGFINLFSVSKTLRFELIPDEKTKNNIEAKGLLQSDKQRADDYKRVKHIIDESLLLQLCDSAI